MTLQALVRDAFAPGSALSKTIEAFLPRVGQAEMATAVSRTIDHGGKLVVEAGTGIGKTFAYLVPALLCGHKVLLSTATKTLQDQLFGRDLPGLLNALGLPHRAALLKGRASYLCLHRLQTAYQHSQANLPQVAGWLASVEVWAQSTVSGDLAELPDIDEKSPVLALVTSSRDNCLGCLCPQVGRCHVNRARREAMAADVIVINHHLFFADLAVRESGQADLLPSVRTVIFDEAHRLNDIGVQFLGRQMGTAQLFELSRDMLACGLHHAVGLADWQQLAADIEHGARDLRLMFGVAPAATRWRWATQVPEGVDAPDWTASLITLKQACERSQSVLLGLRDRAPDFGHLHQRLVDFLETMDVFGKPCVLGSARWMEVGTHLRLVESPVDIAQAVKRWLPDGPDGGAGTLKSWIFTSATLGNDPGLSWFTQACGLDDAAVLRIASPFDYAAQAAVHVPSDFSDPGDPEHSAQVADYVARYAPVIGGRTLVLTTTLKALRVVGEALQRRFAEPNGLAVLVQGQRPKHDLIARFRRGMAPDMPGCILVASASFWEGVDVPGDALQMVVIDKLPFPPPNDPMVEARCNSLKSAGRRPFIDYFVPEAAMALRQGAGRLIRRESDRGVLVICDSRLLAKAYGRRLLASLPPMRLVSLQGDFETTLQALAEATKPSTTGSDCP